jgi:hypothetical protein
MKPVGALKIFIKLKIKVVMILKILKNQEREVVFDYENL